MDISDCGFIKVPTLTTSIEGLSGHSKTLGSSSVHNPATDSFRLNLFSAVVGDIKKEDADERSWNVKWVAIGYIC